MSEGMMFPLALLGVEVLGRGETPRPLGVLGRGDTPRPVDLDAILAGRRGWSKSSQTE